VRIAAVMAGNYTLVPVAVIPPVMVMPPVRMMPMPRRVVAPRIVHGPAAVVVNVPARIVVVYRSIVDTIMSVPHPVVCV
jgi:hypothetical protein